MRIVIPSVNYADLLAVTLPAWRALFPDASCIVATTAKDLGTQRVAAQAGAQVFITDAWTRPGFTKNALSPVSAFNKALALDEAFGFVESPIVPPAEGECCLSLDGDVYPFGKPIQETDIQPDTLYGCLRYQCLSPKVLRAHQRGKTPRSRLALLNAARICLGYFQLFRYRAGLRFGSFWDASRYDNIFRRKFTTKTVLEQLYVLHLGEQARKNWRGRVVPAWPSEVA